MICPDCGLSMDTPHREGTPWVCSECIKQAVPEPPGGWPVISRWVGMVRGRGVFARQGISQGETVERCWVMPLPVDESQASLTMGVLNRYLFPWVGGQRAIISGAGLIYNFDKREVTRREPNLECVLRAGISAIEFRARRDIREGEELSWDYQRARQLPR